MNAISCTNCKESFSVDEEHYKSKSMTFDCNNCGVLIKWSSDAGAWQAVENRPVPEKAETDYVFTSPTTLLKEEQKPRTLIDMVKVWRDRVVTLGWFVAGFNILLLFFPSHIVSVTFFLVSINVVKVLILAYFVAFLLECLAKHLENQQEMLELLKVEKK